MPAADTAVETRVTVLRSDVPADPSPVPCGPPEWLLTDELVNGVSE